MKKCPHCNEMILADALKCKYCKEWIDDPAKETLPSASNNTDGQCCPDGRCIGHLKKDGYCTQCGKHFTEAQEIDKTNPVETSMLISNYTNCQKPLVDNARWNKIIKYSVLIIPVIMISCIAIYYFINRTYYYNNKEKVIAEIRNEIISKNYEKALSIGKNFEDCVNDNDLSIAISDARKGLENNSSSLQPNSFDAQSNNNIAITTVKLINDYENYYDHKYGSKDSVSMANRLHGIFSGSELFIAGTGLTIELYVKFENNNSYPIRDIRYSCIQYAESGTAIKESTGVKYIGIEANSYAYRTLNLGFNQQDVRIIECRCTGFSKENKR